MGFGNASFKPLLGIKSREWQNFFHELRRLWPSRIEMLVRASVDLRHLPDIVGVTIEFRTTVGHGLS